MAWLTLFSLSVLPETGDMPMKYLCIKVKNIYRIVMYLLPGEEAMKAERNCTLSNPVFYFVVDQLNCRNRDGVVGR